MPEFYGPLPPGEVVALQANPVVVERLTGAAQAAVRAATPVGGVPAELPPPRELLDRLADALSITGADARLGRRAVARRSDRGRQVTPVPIAAGRFVTDVDPRRARAPRSARTGSVLLDVRTAGEFDGASAIPATRARAISRAPGTSTSRCCSRPDTDGIRALVGAPAGSEVIAYCHSGSRSAMAAQLLAAAGYEARNYVGSWHEWSADPDAAGRVSRDVGSASSTARRRGTRCRAGGRARSRRRGARPSRAGSVGGFRQLRRALDEPAVEHVPRHLGVELDAPRALAEPVGLAGGVVLGEQLGARRQLEGVVVPLEGVDPVGEHAEHRVVAARRR